MASFNRMRDVPSAAKLVVGEAHDSVPRMLPRAVAHWIVLGLSSLAGVLFVARASAQGPPCAADAHSTLDAFNVILEAQPPLRLGASFIHAAGSRVRFEESLTTGFASLPNLELRGALDWDEIAPLRIWIAYRIRRIALADLPPIEQHLVAGVGLTSDVRRRISLYANIGAAFQLPPLVADAAHDFGTYAIENVALVTAFGLRVRAW